jgi:hypothetical protein
MRAIEVDDALMVGQEAAVALRLVYRAQASGLKVAITTGFTRTTVQWRVGATSNSVFRRGAERIK